MDRAKYYSMMGGNDALDYGRYLNSGQLLTAQKPLDTLCNKDELQFQIVHQVEELWMKLILFTLLDIDEFLQAKNTQRVLTLFGRVHQLQQLMIQQLALLETMSPKEYQEIRLQLGNGSGQESPGFKALLTAPTHLWKSYDEAYLSKRTLSEIYDSGYTHCEAYVVGEALAEFDELFCKFRMHHLQLIRRTIGLGAKSLKGRPVEMMEKGIKSSFFPELWEVRSAMTDAWGGQYGVVRDAISTDT
jgi:tryptophan 2,3-dioxygenase